MEEFYFLKLKKLVDSLCTKGVNNGVFPGVTSAVLTELNGFESVITAFSGKTRLDEKAIKINEKFYFDLASLTKPLSTSLILFSMFKEGLFDWKTMYTDITDRKIPIEKRKINIGQLLSHSSGLSSYKPYFKGFKPCYNDKAKEKIIDLILNDPLEYKPGSECQYSDLGFILLGDLLEQLTGKTLDTLFREKITKPLGLENDLFFIPLIKSNERLKKKCLATEQCRWRKRIIHGEVHDEHCFLMGGVAGHSGLFGTVKGVMVLCKNILKKWQGVENSLPVNKNIFNLVLQKNYPNRSWCMGFDTPSSGYTSAGKYMSKQAVGHLGYSGTSFWIDPVYNCIIVLLTNRIHLHRENMKIREFRPWFHEQIIMYIIKNKR